MAKKKIYYIPKIEITSLQTTEIMGFDLGGSGDHDIPPDAPKRRTPAF